MWKRAAERPLVIGHRGAAGHAPENTLPSIERAIALGADAVEIDIHLADDRLVVIHDESVDRTTDGQGLVADLSIAQLRSLDAGGGAKIPFLEEVLELVSGRAGLVIEIKARSAAIPLAKLLAAQLAVGSWDAGDLLVISFDQPALVLAKRETAALQIAPLLYGVPHDFTACASHIGAVAYNGHFKAISEEILSDARARGQKVLAFTPNHPRDLARMVGLGIDGITTDFPDRAFDAIRSPTY